MSSLLRLTPMRYLYNTAIYLFNSFPYFTHFQNSHRFPPHALPILTNIVLLKLILNVPIGRPNNMALSLPNKLNVQNKLLLFVLKNLSQRIVPNQKILNAFIAIIKNQKLKLKLIQPVVLRMYI
jgi:hypothetical protein